MLSLVSLVKQPLTGLVEISPPALPSQSLVSLLLIVFTTAKYIKGNTSYRPIHSRCTQYTVLFDIIYGKSTLNLLQNQDKDVTPGRIASSFCFSSTQNLSCNSAPASPLVRPAVGVILLSGRYWP